MALKREQQLKTLANRIGVNRGQGFDDAIVAAKNEAAQVENTINNISVTAHDYLKRVNTEAGKKAALETEFGSKTITYEDDKGVVHNMEMIVPVERPDFQSISKQAAYDETNFTMYKNATEAALHEIVDTAAVDAASVGASMDEYQKLVEGKTAVYIEELPENFKQIAKTQVADRLAIKAPNVHSAFVQREAEAFSENIANMKVATLGKSFEAAIMGDVETFEKNKLKYDETSLIMETSNHYTSDVHRTNDIAELQANFILDQKIMKLFGNSLSHDPSNPDTGNLLDTATNLQALQTLLSNPSQSSVTIKLDDGTTKTITRAELTEGIAPEDWYQISETKATSISKYISANGTTTKKAQKISGIRDALKQGIYDQKDAADIFADSGSLQILKEQYTQHTGKNANDDERDFERFLISKANGLMTDMRHRATKQFLSNPDVVNPTALDTMILLDESGITNIEALGFSESQQAVYQAFSTHIRNGNTPEQAAKIIRDHNAQHIDATTNKNVPGLSDKLGRASSDINTIKKLDEYIIKQISEYNDGFGLFFITDENTWVSQSIVNDITRHVRNELRYADPTTDNIDHYVAKRMEEIHNGRDPLYGLSESTIDGTYAISAGSATEPRLVKHRAEYTYGEMINGELSVEYILPLLKEKVKENPPNLLPDIRLGDTWSDSNIRLQLTQPGRNPTYNLVYVSDAEHRILATDDIVLDITKEEFVEELKLYRDYTRSMQDISFEEWRKVNGN